MVGKIFYYSIIGNNSVWNVGAWGCGGNSLWASLGNFGRECGGVTSEISDL